MSKQMFGVQLVGHGGPENLILRDDLPIPTPGPDEALVRVRAAGVNNTDINTRLGWYAKEVTSATNEVGNVIEGSGWSGALHFPRIQGGDLCGEIVAFGARQARFEIGQRVTCPTNQPMPSLAHPVYFEALGSERDGAFAEFCCVPVSQLYDVSASPLSNTEIGAMPCAFGTALNLLHRADVGPKDEVLITGASGGVGLAAVQLAKIRGANVTAIAASAKSGAVKEAGADWVLDRGATVEKERFSAVIDVVGGGRFNELLEALRPAGRLAISGAIAGPIADVDLRTMYLKDLILHGCTYQAPEVFSELVALINSGAVRPLVSRTYPLSEIVAAQEDFVSKRYPGKLVLLPPG